MPIRLSAQNLPAAMAKIVDALSSGQLAVLPTETVYGLAGDATSGVAVARIFELKQRPQFNPLICHVSDQEMAAEHGMFDEVAKQLANAFWPGPLTMVLPRKPGSPVHDLATAGLDTIGIRCPIGLARQVIAEFGEPLAAPSANRSGRVSPTTADHVMDEFPEAELPVLDSGPCLLGIESTIVKVEKDRLVLLRPGSITRDELRDTTGLPVDLPPNTGPITAPGMLKSHYAPMTPVVLGSELDGDRVAILAFGADDPHGCRERALACVNLSKQGDLIEAAANLYAAMKELDEVGASAICVEPVPETGVGVAINDRLRRAAAPREGK